ncbi:MAG: EAL domain-containing protein [Nitrospirota bacterium]|nr:EAL domain-containing protein [Nitrospirota bacterium]
MKRKIIISLLLLFLFSASGAVTATLYIRNTTATLGRLIQLHKIGNMRQHLIITIQTVQSELYTIGTPLGHDINAITDNVSRLDDAVQQCTNCHAYHSADVITEIGLVQTDIQQYEHAISNYITTSANQAYISRLKLNAAEIGNRLLARTGQMASAAAEKLEHSTAEAMLKIGKAQTILTVTILFTFLLGISIAANLVTSVTRPIAKLVEATRAIAEGNLGQTVDTTDKTEFGLLAKHFNAMSAALQENYTKLEVEITERKGAIEALRESEERYALAARGANDGLWDWDIRHNYIFYSVRWKSMLGFEETEIGNTLAAWLDLVHPADREQLEAKLSAHINDQTQQFECEYRVRHKDGAYRWVLSRGLAVRNGNGKALRMAGSQTDITARKTAEEQLLYDAFHDALTGLPNRALFMDRLEHVIASARRHPDYLYAVLFVDLDRFKVINDSMGHGVGDMLLIEVGLRIKAGIRPGDTVARLGGDEFAVLLEDIKSVGDAEDVTRRIEEELAHPYRIQDHEIISTQSIGVALKSDRYEWPEQILRDADIAMYQAKSDGRARHEFFDTNMHASIIDRLQLEADLRVAVEHQQGFVLHYQPIMNLKTRQLKGFESLVRWKHPTRGLLYPLEFIPLAEETGLILPLTKWILLESCKQLRLWQKKYDSDTTLAISVNVSSKTLVQPGFVDTVASVLNNESLPQGSLALEITESVLMEHTTVAMDAMTRLQSMGVHIHIDDFGTGYSSLSYLHSFPVNALKIDRSFIAKLSSRGDNQEIVRTIITLAQNLRLEVIAEGVEQSDQLSTICDLDCHYGQGFLFSKPLSPSEMEHWMTLRNEA